VGHVASKHDSTALRLDQGAPTLSILMLMFSFATKKTMTVVVVVVVKGERGVGFATTSEALNCVQVSASCSVYNDRSLRYEI
jgi:hypothetical protein